MDEWSQIKANIKQLIKPVEELRIDDLYANDIIISEGVTYDAMKQAYIEKSISELFKPYKRTGSQIVYYCSSKDRWKANIPTALRIPGIPLPQTAKSEAEMWTKLYQYFINYLKTDDPDTNVSKHQKMVVCITALFSPYIRKTDEIIISIPSKNAYKIYIPSVFRKTGVAVPQTAKDKNTLIERVYTYLKENFPDNEAVQDMVTTIDGGPDGDTFNDLFKVWIKKKRGDASIATETTRRDMNTFKRHFEGDPLLRMHIGKITVTTIYEFLHKCIYGVRPEITGKVLSLEPKISRHELNNIKTITNGVCQLAISMGMIHYNPSRECDMSKVKLIGINNESLAYTDEERLKVLSCIDSLSEDEHNCYTLGIGLMFCLDIRIGELKALRWSDVDWNNRTIRVFREVIIREQSDGVRRQVEIDRTKGGEIGGRVQILTDRALNYLKIAHEKNPSGHHILLTGWGNCFYTNKFNLALKDICEKAGVRYMSSHKIRFWAISAQGRNTNDLGTIMYNSGHRNKSTTLHYMRQNQVNTENEKIWDRIFG